MHFANYTLIADANARPHTHTHTEFMICRHCGRDITVSNHLLNQRSPAAVSVAHQRLYGQDDVLVQELVNPLGNRFRVVAVRHAQCARADRVSASIAAVF